MNLQEFAQSIEAAQRKARKDAHAKPFFAASTPASALGYNCLRRLTYMRADPAAAAPPNEELSSIFTEGKIHEAQVRRELSELGFEVLEGEVMFEDKALDIRGHIDGKIRTPWGVKVPVEIKSWSGDGPHSEEQWKNSSDLMRRYYAQMTMYLYLTAEPEGLLLTKNKLTGLWAVAPARLNYEFAEELLKKAEAVRDAVKLQVLPERLADRSECQACPWFTTCLPGDAPVDPLLIAEDESLIDDLRAREQLRRGAGHFKDLDGKIKERFKLTQGSRFIAGEFVITKRTTKNGAVYVETEVAPGSTPEPPKVKDLIDDLKRSLEAD